MQPIDAEVGLLEIKQVLEVIADTDRTGDAAIQITKLTVAE